MCVCVLLLSCSETTEVTDIGPYKVPEGIVVWPMIYALQNSINNWEDPEDFNPVSHHTIQAMSLKRCHSQNSNWRMRHMTALLHDTSPNGLRACRFQVS